METNKLGLTMRQPYKFTSRNSPRTFIQTSSSFHTSELCINTSRTTIKVPPKSLSRVPTLYKCSTLRLKALPDTSRLPNELPLKNTPLAIHALLSIKKINKKEVKTLFLEKKPAKPQVLNNIRSLFNPPVLPKRSTRNNSKFSIRNSTQNLCLLPKSVPKKTFSITHQFRLPHILPLHKERAQEIRGLDESPYGLREGTFNCHPITEGSIVIKTKEGRHVVDNNLT